MNLKTLTGSSIQEALAEARRQYGDEVVLIESEVGGGEESARITVVLDEPVAAREPAPTGPPARKKKQALEHKAPQHRAMQPAGAGAGGLLTEGKAALEAPPEGVGSTEEDAARAEENFSEKLRQLTAASSRAKAYRRAEKPTSANDSSHRSGRGNGRGRLFQNDNQISEMAASQERLIEQIDRLQERIDAMEHRFGQALVGTSQRWAAHPLFGWLLKAGLRPGTATQLFNEAVEHRHPSNTDTEELRWALMRGLRDLLARAAPARTSGPLMLVGPGGAGKTSLLLKLATNESFYGRHRPAVIIIAPSDDPARTYQSPAELYRRFELPVQVVHNEAEMQQALERTRTFDHLLIDTPSLPADAARARPVLRRLQRLTGAVVPLQVHYVTRATQVLEGTAFSEEGDPFEGGPLQPDAAAVTSLDEAPGWGCTAEWVVALDRPVQFVSTGTRVPEDVAAFSPAWFVDEMVMGQERSA